MSHVFPYQRDGQRRTLSPGNAPIEALGLRLTLSAEPVPGSPFGEMVLQIDNLRDVPVAYRVQTKPSSGTQACHAKRALPQNAIALAPRATVRRTECVHREGWVIEVQSIETMELPPLAYFYVSAVPPNQIGLEERTARGHLPPQGAACSTVHSASIERARERGEIGWRDMVDFYGRHRCRTYIYPPKYKAFKGDGEISLPAVRESY
jgi:hypothetical protein